MSMVPLPSLSKTPKAARNSASESAFATLWAIIVANSGGMVSGLCSRTLWCMNLETFGVV